MPVVYILLSLISLRSVLHLADASACHAASALSCDSGKGIEDVNDVAVELLQRKAIARHVGGAATYNTTAWRLDFTDRQAATELFEEDTGLLGTSGSLSCMEPSHVLYNQSLFGCQDGQQKFSGRNGLQLVLDYDVTCGKKDVKLATGHLTSKASFMYGSFDFVMRSHHPKDSCEQPETYAGFSCISLYTSEPVWNEIAVCFAKFAPQQEVHLTVYSGEKQGEHEKKFPVFGAYVTLDEPTNLNFHNYTVQRLPSGIAFWVDGVKKLDVDKSQCSQLPTEPMKMRVILRPYSDSIEGSATIVDIQSMEAQPLDDARANILAESIEKARDAEFEKMTDTETTQYLHVAPFKGEFDDWVQIKQDIFAALGLEYPGVGLLSRNPVKRASVVAHDTIIMLGDEAQAIKAQDFVNNATAKGRECYGKADCKSWQARAVTEAEYSMLGAAPIEYSES
mmetsp:Transcript_80915/g.152970  ORF Transcript_80915/g.152970 Transcript_80915/m.152970 type:complete len:451 (+) Transcript_80915:125-1477(+)